MHHHCCSVPCSRGAAAAVQQHVQQRAGASAPQLHTTGALAECRLPVQLRCQGASGSGCKLLWSKRRPDHLALSVLLALACLCCRGCSHDATQGVWCHPAGAVGKKALAAGEAAPAELLRCAAMLGWHAGLAVAAGQYLRLVRRVVGACQCRHAAPVWYLVLPGPAGRQARPCVSRTGVVSIRATHRGCTWLYVVAELQAAMSASRRQAWACSFGWCCGAQGLRGPALGSWWPRAGSRPVCCRQLHSAAAAVRRALAACVGDMPGGAQLTAGCGQSGWVSELWRGCCRSCSMR